MVERIFAPAEIVANSGRPTSLDLFRCSNTEMTRLKRLGGVALGFKSEFASAQNSFNSLVEVTKARAFRLNDSANDLTSQLDGLRSELSCTLVYQEMLEEFTPKGLSQKDIYDFFNLCLDINTQFNTQLLRKFRNTNIQSLNATLSGHQKELESMIKSSAQHRLGNPPAWFRQGKKAWESFVMNYSNFGVYLNKTLTQISSSRGFVTSKELVKYGTLGGVLKDQYPDWLIGENSGIPPTKEALEKETLEDREQIDGLLHQIDYVKSQSSFLRTMSEGKFIKAAVWVERRKRGIFPNNAQGIAELVIFLDATRNLIEYTADLDKMAQMDSKTLSKYSIDYKALSELKIRQFAESVAPTSIQCIALLLEKSLKSGNITSDVRQTITDNIKAVFNPFFDSVRSGNTDTNQARELRQTNKRAYSALVYDLKPFFKILSW